MAIIDDVLDFSKIEAGRFQVEQQEFAVYHASVVQRSECSRFYRWYAKQLYVRLIVGTGVPLQIDKRRRRLFDNVLMDLIGNPIEFTHYGDKLRSCYEQPLEKPAILS